jgi:acyl-CoA reductase-like NAD-dependent aldehyde dehydrogenase
MSGKKSVRLDVKKTYKLFINGAFPRSESGRSYPIYSGQGKMKELLAQPAQASRKDLRDAVRAARDARSKWQGATAYNRSQILYRIAELLEGRRSQFVEEIMAQSNITKPSAEFEVSEAIDLWVWYAGWCDKIGQIAGANNPINAPYYNFTSPEPVGVVGVFAEEESTLLGLVRSMAPALAGGNTVVVIASESRPLSAITLSEVLATSDVPAGVVNILTGIRSELAPWLASHMEVDALDISGIIEPRGKASGKKSMHEEIRTLATENLKRIADFGDSRTPDRIVALMDQKTIWHPIGI